MATTNLGPFNHVTSSRHASYLNNSLHWFKFRTVYGGGEFFRDQYLQKFTDRESNEDFLLRKAMTPIRAFAKSAVNRIRNSIFQRLSDVTRHGGSKAYQSAVSGLNGGVDRRGASMNYFLGHDVLTDLLVIGRVGIYVDMPSTSEQPSLAALDAGGIAPYLYFYPAEDICNFSFSYPEAESEFQSVLLRDRYVRYDNTTYLPIATQDRYRMLWLGDNGKVQLAFYDIDGNQTDRFGQPSGEITELNLTRIPFVMPDIGDSLMKDIADHQIALLNQVSWNVQYDLKANFPFYVEQKDRRAIGDHLKKVNTDGSATTGGQGANDEKIAVGPVHGRYYQDGMDAPQFIAPPDGPLRASIEFQQALKEEIYEMVDLAVQTLASRQSAESKGLDNQNLEAGLSYIGLVLENAERKINDYWSAYENTDPTAREVAVVKYPEQYSLKTDDQRITEATKLQAVQAKLPSNTAKKELSKSIVCTMLEGKVSPDVIRTIYGEIDKAEFTTTDPDTIIQAHQEGLVSDEIGSKALGFPANDYKQAQKDAADRAARVIAAQSSAKGPKSDNGDPAARGVPELSTNPNDAAAAERQGKQTRGDGNQIDKGGY